MMGVFTGRGRMASDAVRGTPPPLMKKGKTVLFTAGKGKGIKIKSISVG
jgi:hypothetical protein